MRIRVRGRGLGRARPAGADDAMQALLAEVRKQPELDSQALFTIFGTSTPEYDFDLDRTKTKLPGLNLTDVFNMLEIELGSLYINDFNLFGHTYTPRSAS
jgi:multidrug efflux pump subunit AcrB